MNDISNELKVKWISRALEQLGFEEMPAPGIFARQNNENKILVNLNEKQPCAIFIVGTERVAKDDDNNTLLTINQIIVDAESGVMPGDNDQESTPEQPDDTHTEPESAQKDGVDFNVDPDTWPDGWDPSMGPSPKESIKHAPAEVVHPTAPPAPFTPQGTMIKTFVPGLKEIGKIKIGRKGEMKKSRAGNEYRPPEKFNHFEVVTLHKDDNGDFIPDAAVMGLIGDDCKELDVSLLYNDPTLNFFTRFNQYKGGKCMCSGDGERAVQADGTELACNPDTCPVFATKHCKPNGILSVVLKDAPRLGGVYKFRTTSVNSIRSILSSMFFIQSLTGGVLADIPLKMTIAPQSVNPVGSPTAQTIYVVNLEYPGNMDDLHKQTIELMTRKAGMQNKIVELEAQARIAITAPETKEDIQDAEYEFYPETVKEESK